MSRPATLLGPGCNEPVLHRQDALFDSLSFVSSSSSSQSRSRPKPRNQGFFNLDVYPEPIPISDASSSREPVRVPRPQRKRRRSVELQLSQSQSRSGSRSRSISISGSGSGSRGVDTPASNTRPRRSISSSSMSSSSLSSLPLPIRSALSPSPAAPPSPAPPPLPSSSASCTSTSVSPSSSRSTSWERQQQQQQHYGVPIQHQSDPSASAARSDDGGFGIDGGTGGDGCRVQRDASASAGASSARTSSRSRSRSRSPSAPASSPLVQSSQRAQGAGEEPIQSRFTGRNGTAAATTTTAASSYARSTGAQGGHLVLQPQPRPGAAFASSSAPFDAESHHYSNATLALGGHLASSFVGVGVGAVAAAAAAAAGGGDVPGEALADWVPAQFEDDDWTDVNADDLGDADEPDYCFFCACTQTSGEALNHKWYQKLCSFIKDHFAFMSPKELCKGAQDIYEKRLRRCTEKKLPWRQETIWKHLTVHAPTIHVTLESTLRTMNAIEGVLRRTMKQVDKTTGKEQIVERVFNMYLKLVKERAPVATRVASMRTRHVL